MSDQESNLIRSPVPGVDPKYGALLRGGDATKSPDQLVSKLPYHPVGRPAMNAATEARWDAYQAQNRNIKVRVVCVPPARKDNGEPFPRYWCAKRGWPSGASETMVSPHELLEMEKEDPKILQVEVIGERKRAYSIPALIGRLAAETKEENDWKEKLMSGQCLPHDIPGEHRTALGITPDDVEWSRQSSEDLAAPKVIDQVEETPAETVKAKAKKK